MHSDNPEPPAAEPLAGRAFDGSTSPAYPPWQSPPSAHGVRIRGALSAWLVILSVFGVGGLLFGQQDLAALVALSGVFVAAQAADLDARWGDLYRILSLGFVGLCTSILFAVAWMLQQSPPSDLSPSVRIAVEIIAAVGGLVMVATAVRPVADLLVRAVFRERESTHSLRLAARLVLFCLLFSVPAVFAMRDLFEDPEAMSNLLDEFSSGSGVLGYLLLAFASVGFLVRRDLPEVLDRLGIRGVRARDVGLIIGSVVALFALNAGGEWIERRWFPDMFASDQSINEALASSLDKKAMLVVGLSAGIGEEITLRGALQPKLGLVLTALVFASLHVQYSWFGVTTIFLFGLLLGLIRKASNTTTAITVHAIYDIVALFTT
jgi:membrane protease YdiL (CAAX protease family)